MCSLVLKINHFHLRSMDTHSALNIGSFRAFRRALLWKGQEKGKVRKRGEMRRNGNEERWGWGCSSKFHWKMDCRGGRGREKGENGSINNVRRHALCVCLPASTCMAETDRMIEREGDRYGETYEQTAESHDDQRDPMLTTSLRWRHEH